MAVQHDESDNLKFDRMAAVHRGARRGYWLYAVLLCLVGLGLIIGGYFGYLPWLVGLITGIIAVAVAIIPVRQAVERGERVEGLIVLQEEWKELLELGESAANEREQFLALMRRLYA